MRKLKKASKLLNVFKPLPQVLENILVKDKEVINSKRCRNAIKEANNIPEPKINFKIENTYNIVFAGIGGTGVVTMGTLLALAAKEEKNLLE